MNKQQATRCYNKYHKVYATMLSLTSWHIKLVYNKKSPEHDGSDIQMELNHFNDPYNEVELTIYYKTLSNEEEFRRVLLHEYLHIVVYPMGKYSVKAKQAADEETVVSHLTNVLYPMLHWE